MQAEWTEGDIRCRSKGLRERVLVRIPYILTETYQDH